MRLSIKPSLDWLLVFVPAAIVMQLVAPERQSAIFVACCLGIVPLAGWLGRATDHLAARTSEAVGGLLNATFGNAAELIIALMALRSGLFTIVKASLTGSIIGNLLLVLGASMLAGGVRHPVQQFSERAARVGSTMMTLAAIGLIVPAAFHHLAGGAARLHEGELSLAIAIVLLATYALSLWFTLRTHRDFFLTPHTREDENRPRWSTQRSLAVLVGATALIAWLSEILVGAVEHAAESFGMTSLFVGVIVVAIIGNAAEHSSAITFAMENRMDLSLAIAAGSSTQIALFAAPVLVLASYVMGGRPMDLVFSPVEVLAVGLAVAIAGQISNDGESNWLEGVQLLAVYAIIGATFYFLPESAAN